MALAKTCSRVCCSSRTRITSYNVCYTKLLRLPEDAAQKVVANFKPTESTSETEKLNFHQALKATSPTYTNILGEIRAILNELPPSAAMSYNFV